MSTVTRGPVVVDTGVFASRFTRSGGPLELATAIHLDVPLVAHDAIFHRVAGLELLTRL